MWKCWFLTALTLFSCGAYSAPRVQFDTNLGSFIIELNPEKAPITVDNFLKYVGDGSYVGSVFHRVIPKFIIQGGGFTAEMVRLRTYPPIVNESANGLSNKKWTIAMARPAAPNSATRQFFINLNDNDFLDRSNRPPGYAVFGKVISGFSVVEAMSGQPTENQGFMKDVPTSPIIIGQVTLLPAAEPAHPQTVVKESEPDNTTVATKVTPVLAAALPVTTPATTIPPKATAAVTTETEKPPVTAKETLAQPHAQTADNTEQAEQTTTVADVADKTETDETDQVSESVATNQEAPPVTPPTDTSQPETKPVVVNAPDLSDLSSMLTLTEPARQAIEFIPEASLRNRDLVANKAFHLIMKDARKSSFVAFSGDASFDVQPINAQQDVQKAIQNVLLQQFEYQGFTLSDSSINTLTVEIPKALVYVKNSTFKNQMVAKVVIAITAETPRGKLVKTYHGTAKRTAAFSASSGDIEHVLNDISSQVLKKVAEDTELQDYMKERF